MLKKPAPQPISKILKERSESKIWLINSSRQSLSLGLSNSLARKELKSRARSLQ